MSEQLHPKKKVPFSFVLEELAALAPAVKPMFGSFMVYIGERMMLFLCEREKEPFYKGIWVATTSQHYESLAQELSLTLDEQPWKIGAAPWLAISASATDFEEQAVKVCELILNGDPRIGHLPKSKPLKPGKKEQGSKRKTRTKS